MLRPYRQFTPYFTWWEPRTQVWFWLISMVRIGVWMRSWLPGTRAVRPLTAKRANDSGFTPWMPNSPFLPELRAKERLMCLRSPQLKRNSLMTVGEKLCTQFTVVFQWRFSRVPARGSANSFG